MTWPTTVPNFRFLWPPLLELWPFQFHRLGHMRCSASQGCKKYETIINLELFTTQPLWCSVGATWAQRRAQELRHWGEEAWCMWRRLRLTMRAGPWGASTRYFIFRGVDERTLPTVNGGWMCCTDRCILNVVKCLRRHYLVIPATSTAHWTRTASLRSVMLEVALAVTNVPPATTLHSPNCFDGG